MSDIKLVYFDVRGRGEAIRLVLHAAGQQFDDIRVAPETWGQELKADTPYGQLPYMVYKGKKYGQSLAIGGFLARKFDLYGKSDEHGLRIDEVTHLCDDLRRHIRAWRLEHDPQKKAEIVQKLKDETFPRYLGYFEALLADNSSTGFFVGDSVSFADLVLYDMLDTVVALGSRAALIDFPCQQKLRDNVENIPTVKEYLKNRPSHAP